jgi:hypothetical protein
MQEPSLAAKLGAEFLGTFLLVFCGCGSVVIASEFLSENDVQIGIGLLGISQEATSIRRSASAWRSRSDSSGRVCCPTPSLRS